MDLRSIFQINLILSFVAALLFILIWVQNRKRYDGLLHWAVQFGVYGLGTLLISLRDHIPDFWSIVVSNGLIFFSMLLIISGFEKFFSLKPTSRITIYPCAAAVLLYFVFTFIRPDLQARLLVFNSYYLLILIQTLWILTNRLPREMFKLTDMLRVVFVLYIINQCYRLAMLLILPSATQNFFESDIFETSYIIINIFLTMAFVINLILLYVRRLTLEFAAEETKFNIIFEQAPYAIALTRISDQVILNVNASFEELSGYRRDEVIGNRAQALGLWADPSIREQLQQTLESGKNISSLELMFRRKNGELLPALYSASFVLINHESFMLSSLKDISDIVDLRGKLEIMATHDALTHLPNRVLFADRFKVASAQASRSGTKFVAAIFDLDDFKSVNDKLGHNVGDQLLVAVADRVGRFIRLTDTVARFGGDEFVLLLNNIQNKASAEETLNRVLELYRQPFEIDGHTLKATISIGAAIYPDDANNEIDLLRKADEALYQVKRLGKNGLRFFEAEH